MTTLLRAALPAFLLALLPGAVPAPRERAPDLPRDPALTVGTLPNGLRYYLRVNDTPSGRAELRLVVNAGSALEDDDQQGFAHFLEHMAFNGTRTFPHDSLIAFIEASGKNRTPDRLPPSEREALFAACDSALGSIVDLLQPRHVVGIGAFAEANPARTAGRQQIKIGRAHV